jgi:heptosyltransferase-1
MLYGYEHMQKDAIDILFVKLGALGDVINTLPLANALKDGLGARIHWLVEPLSLPILDGHPAVYRTILFDRPRWPAVLPGVLHRLRASRFDIALDLQRTAKSALFCLASISQRKIGFDRARCKELAWLLPFERIPASDPERHMVRQYLEFAHFLGSAGGEVRWDIPIRGRPPFGLPGDYIVLNTGATKPANRWSTEGFASLASMTKARFSLPCVLTGGAQDAPAAGVIESMAKGCVVNLAGKTGMAELKEVLAGARAVVSCDTGPMHLAVALGREVVALMGPSNPRRTGPYRGRVVRLELECMPCNRKKCEDPRCMRGITPDMVMSRLEEIL